MTVFTGFVAGCGDSGVKTITTPPGEGGNRARLKALEKNTELLKSDPRLNKKRR